jgi:hypothetical protein|tara:strand:+ start:32 stop:415 length:384 start_codon:yes stop_codon:yes gene_type:complete
MPKIVNKTQENARMVTQLSGLGLPHEQICSILNISKPSLYKYYQEELLNGKATANAKVAENLFKIATGTGREAVSAGIFWLKCQARWHEKQILEIQDGTEQDDKFRQLIKDIQRAKLTETDSDNTTH